MQHCHVVASSRGMRQTLREHLNDIYVHIYIFLILITETNNLTLAYYIFIPIHRC